MWCGIVTNFMRGVEGDYIFITINILNNTQQSRKVKHLWMSRTTGSMLELGPSRAGPCPAYLADKPA
jgi:hypothetical protein